ncbi:MAG: DUF2480 family protein [Flavobacteriaceae bacterium]
MEEIINRVSKSPLVTIDLEDFYPKKARTGLDIAPWLFENIILKEKDFRAYLEEHNWEQYQGHFTYVFSSSDAIIPSWAYLLIATKLAPYASKVHIGTKEGLENEIYQEIVADFDTEPLKDKPVIIKGCSKVYIPESAYTALILKIQPHVKSLMFGEACSTVPLYKRKKS